MTHQQTMELMKRAQEGCPHLYTRKYYTGPTGDGRLEEQCQTCFRVFNVDHYERDKKAAKEPTR